MATGLLLCLGCAQTMRAQSEKKPTMPTRHLSAAEIGEDTLKAETLVPADTLVAKDKALTAALPFSDTGAIDVELLSQQMALQPFQIQKATKLAYYSTDFNASDLVEMTNDKLERAAAASPYPADKKNAPRATQSPWSNPEGRQIK